MFSWHYLLLRLINSRRPRKYSRRLVALCVVLLFTAWALHAGYDLLAVGVFLALLGVDRWFTRSDDSDDDPPPPPTHHPGAGPAADVEPDGQPAIESSASRP